jgi:hypothetical protein
LKKITDI